MSTLIYFVAVTTFLVAVIGHNMGKMTTLDSIYWLSGAGYFMALAVYSKVRVK